MTKHIRPLASLAALLALALGVRALGLPHPGPPVNLEFAIAPDRISLRVVGEQAALNPWLGLEREDYVTLEELDEERRQLVRSGWASFFEENNPMELDGTRLAPAVHEVTLQPPWDGMGPPLIVIDQEWPLESWPRTLRVLWERFDGVKCIDGEYVPLIVRWDGDFEFGQLLREEPEYFWRAPPHLGKPRERVAPVTGSGESEDLPPLAMVLLAAGILSLPFVRGSRAPALVRVLTPTLLLCAGGYAWSSHGRAPWEGSVEVPPADEARAMFETLHANVYEAFSAQSEDGIYDLLARSVAPHMLDQLYLEVYESLILRGEGGAVCDVEKVELVEGSVRVEPDPEQEEEGAPSFEADWLWRVHGLVSHWGHSHQRTNQYHALYTVAHDGASWKIADVEVLDHERIEDYGPTRR